MLGLVKLDFEEVLPPLLHQPQKCQNETGWLLPSEIVHSDSIDLLMPRMAPTPLMGLPTDPESAEHGRAS